MKTERISSLFRGYEPPVIEFITIPLERGFAASYGDEGAPGDGLVDEEDGDYEL